MFAAKPVEERHGSHKPARDPTHKQRKRRKPTAIDKTVLALPALRRVRDREHVKSVAQQPCLVCGRRPADAHQLRFTQSRALGRKVSDEFTVPLCRGHHREVHHCGDEAAWWNKAGIDPTVSAPALWLKTHPLPPSPTKIDQSKIMKRSQIKEQRPMTSLKQIEANRRNALRSTGPKTEAGKEQSRRNAVRHGLTAETVVDVLEDPEDYKAFEKAVASAFDVQPAVERELVLRLASLLWRLRRATRAFFNSRVISTKSRIWRSQSTQRKRPASFRLGNSRNCMTTKKMKTRASQTSRSIRRYHGVFYSSIPGPSNDLDGMKRRCGAKPTKPSLSWIIYDDKIST